MITPTQYQKLTVEDSNWMGCISALGSSGNELQDVTVIVSTTSVLRTLDTSMLQPLSCHSFIYLGLWLLLLI